MVKKRRNPGAEGTGCRPGDHFCDRERSRAWEVDLVVWCWLICHWLPLWVRSRASAPWACALLFAPRALDLLRRRKALKSIDLAEGGRPFLRQMSLNFASEICHLL